LGGDVERFFAFTPPSLSRAAGCLPPAAPPMAMRRGRASARLGRISSSSPSAQRAWMPGWQPPFPYRPGEVCWSL
jgi:hypothetical protein